MDSDSTCPWLLWKFAGHLQTRQAQKPCVVWRMRGTDAEWCSVATLFLKRDAACRAQQSGAEQSIQLSTSFCKFPTVGTWTQSPALQQNARCRLICSAGGPDAPDSRAVTIRLAIPCAHLLPCWLSFFFRAHARSVSQVMCAMGWRCACHHHHHDVWCWV